MSPTFAMPERHRVRDVVGVLWDRVTRHLVDRVRGHSKRRMLTERSGRREVISRQMQPWTVPQRWPDGASGLDEAVRRRARQTAANERPKDNRPLGQEDA